MQKHSTDHSGPTAATLQQHDALGPGPAGPHGIGPGAFSLLVLSRLPSAGSVHRGWDCCGMFYPRGEGLRGQRVLFGDVLVRIYRRFCSCVQGVGHRGPASNPAGRCTADKRASFASQELLWWLLHGAGRALWRHSHGPTHVGLSREPGEEQGAVLRRCGRLMETPAALLHSHSRGTRVCMPKAEGRCLFCLIGLPENVVLNRLRKAHYFCLTSVLLFSFKIRVSAALLLLLKKVRSLC